jgi:hypothetical protein
VSKIDPHFMNHPEARQTLKSAFSEMTIESDRGAVLIGAELIHTALTDLFLKMTPAGLSNKKAKDLLKYPSALSSFAAKTDMAILARYISLDLYLSIQALRVLRNDAAHSSNNFSLADEEAKLKKICNLGTNVEPTLTLILNRWETGVGPR